MHASVVACAAMTLAAAIILYTFGIGPIVVWLLLAAVAAPIVGRAIDSDDAFDVDVLDDDD